MWTVQQQQLSKDGCAKCRVRLHGLAGQVFGVKRGPAPTVYTMANSHHRSWHGLSHSNSNNKQATVSQVQHCKSDWQQLAAAAATTVRLSTNITGYIARSLAVLHMGRSLSGETISV